MEIILRQNYKNYHLQVDLIHKDERCERYKIYPPKSPDKFFIVENNRPLIREVHKLKKRRIDWKKIEGADIRPKTLEEIYQKIEKPLPPEKPIIFPKVTPYDRKKNYGNNSTLEDRMKKD